jgi:DNA repair protein RadC
MATKANSVTVSGCASGSSTARHPRALMSALVKLLLTYGIPQHDVQPLAKALLSRFGTLDKLLAADPKALCEVDGIKTTTAALPKLVDHLRQKPADPMARNAQSNPGPST